MTELEENFYKTFGIEPKPTYNVCNKCFRRNYYGNACLDCIDRAINNEYCYPPITDHILLELVCIMNKTHYKLITSQTIDGLKREVLFDCLAYSDDIKSDVRKLFEDNN